MRKRFTEEEKLFVMQMREDCVPYKEIAEMLGHSTAASIAVLYSNMKRKKSAPKLAPRPLSEHPQRVADIQRTRKPESGWTAVAEPPKSMAQRQMELTVRIWRGIAEAILKEVKKYDSQEKLVKDYESTDSVRGIAESMHSVP